MGSRLTGHSKPPLIQKTPTHSPVPAQTAASSKVRSVQFIQGLLTLFVWVWGWRLWKGKCISCLSDNIRMREVTCKKWQLIFIGAILWANHLRANGQARSLLGFTNRMTFVSVFSESNLQTAWAYSWHLWLFRFYLKWQTSVQVSWHWGLKKCWTWHDFHAIYFSRGAVK